MPLQSTSMVFTWSIESVLLGLISLTVVRDYLTFSFFVISIVTSILHLVCLASTVDRHYEVSISFLCTVTGLLLGACTRPLESVSNIIVLAFLVVAEVAAMGLAFSTTEGGTSLFFHKRGHYAVLVGILIESFQCDPSVGHLTAPVVVLWVVLQLAPFDTIALVSSFAMGIFVGIYFAVREMLPQSTICFLVVLVSLIWFLVIWLLVWFPVLTKLDELDSGSVLRGPWLESTLIVLFVAGSVAFSVVQKEFLVALVAICICMAWVALAWFFRPKKNTTIPDRQMEVPSAPPPHAMLKRSINWPRMRAHSGLKEV